MRYEKFDLMIGIIIVVIGAAAIMGLSAATFAGHPEFSHFTDAGGVARGIEHYVGHLPAVLFAIALIDACIIGAAAVSLSTAYALGDVFAVNHSLHRKPTEAKGFYAVYFGLIAISAGLVLTPGTPLGLLTNLVQTLAGVLLPSATVFLLLLCNDREVLGPWVNGKLTNIITTIVVASLVMLSIILTAAELFPNISDGQILSILLGGTVISVMLSVMVQLYVKFKGLKASKPVLIHSQEQNEQNRIHWRMPPLSKLAPFKLGLLNRIWLGVLRLYLVLAGGLLIVKLVQMALHGTH
ncbi:hypothetical protein F975_00105 [Acinetobacter sp. ANC 3789]|nr:hypothetical protein F975_00105 [Acinetobacter sp. ANC 3789]